MQQQTSNRAQPWRWIEDIQLLLEDVNPSCPYICLNANDVTQVVQVLLTLVEQLITPPVISVA